MLAFDFGARRLGVAVGELTLRIAHPLETIHADSEEVRMEQVGRLIKEWSPVLLVVGLPLHMDGTRENFDARNPDRRKGTPVRRHNLPRFHAPAG